MKLKLLGGALLAVGLMSAIPAQASDRVSIFVGAPSVTFHHDSLRIVHPHPGLRHVYGRPYHHHSHGRHHHRPYCPPRGNYRDHGWHRGHDRDDWDDRRHYRGHDRGRWDRDRR